MPLLDSAADTRSPIALAALAETTCQTIAFTAFAPSRSGFRRWPTGKQLASIHYTCGAFLSVPASSMAGIIITGRADDGIAAAEARQELVADVRAATALAFSRR